MARKPNYDFERRERAFARHLDRLQDAYDTRLRLAIQSPSEKVRPILARANDQVLTPLSGVRSTLENWPLQ